MSPERLLFYFFSALVIFASFMVITSRKPVRAVLFLVAAFVATSGLWLLIEAEYLAIVLILVYVGAVMVLFLFVVMMLDLNVAPIQEGFTRYLPLGTLVATLLGVQLAWILGPQHFGLDAYARPVPLSADYSNAKALGEVLYTQYALPFEMAALLLLVAMIAAVALTFRGPKGRKVQHPSQQVQVKKSDRLVIVKSITK